MGVNPGDSKDPMFFLGNHREKPKISGGNMSGWCFGTMEFYGFPFSWFSMV